MSVKSRQVTKPTMAKGNTPATAVMTRVRGFAGNHTLMRTRAGSGRIPINSHATAGIQPKLTVNAPGDIYEQEADRVAERVMRMPEPTLQRACACGGGCPRCLNEPETHEHLQTKPVQANDSGEASVPPVVHEVLRSSGQPLDRSTREFMEPRFGHDFRKVRLHVDAGAAVSARSVKADAYTVGHDIVFGLGRYQPASVQGRHLLGHELTHVVQQGASIHLKDGVGEPRDASKQQADKVDRVVVDGRSTAPRLDAYRPAPIAGRATGRMVQRQGAEHVFNSPYKAAPDATYVAGRSPQEITNWLNYGTGKGTATKKPTPEELPGLFSKFLKMISTLEKNIQGNATQSWGSIVYGNSDGKDSPATKASKDAKLWASVDYALFMEYMELILVAIPENSDPRETLKSLREELTEKPTNWPKLAELVKEIVEEAEKIKKEAEVPKTKEGAGTSETKAPANQKIKIPPPQTNGVKPKAANTSKPTWYSRDPMSYWNSYPLVAEFEGVSGDPFVLGGAIAIVTDKQGTKRKFRYWIGKDGYYRSEFLKTPSLGAE